MNPLISGVSIDELCAITLASKGKGEQIVDARGVRRYPHIASLCQSSIVPPSYLSLPSCRPAILPQPAFLPSCHPTSACRPTSAILPSCLPSYPPTSCQSIIILPSMERPEDMGKPSPSSPSSPLSSLRRGGSLPSFDVPDIGRASSVFSSAGSAIANARCARHDDPTTRGRVPV